MVKVLEKVGLADEGLKLHDAPAGRPLQDRLTDCAGPPVRDKVMIPAGLKAFPATTLAELGETDIEKSNDVAEGAVTIICLTCSPIGVATFRTPSN